MNLELSIIIVSFNTKELLRRCIKDCQRVSLGLKCEIIVVDNFSSDNSSEMVKAEFPNVKLIQSSKNIGFAGANNLAYKEAQGDYILLLNSDAFIKGDGLKNSLRKIKENDDIGLIGAKLVGPKNEWQPSARSFPNVFNNFFILSGLSSKYPESLIFGRPDMTYMDQNVEFECDWVPGAFSLIRREAIGCEIFDERFFLYSEEVDMCLRLKRNDWKILYFPKVEVIHLGGASTTIFSAEKVSKTGKQMILWQLQSQFLYFRKNYGFFVTLSIKLLESSWNLLRILKNRNSQKAEDSRIIIELIKKAWGNTKGGLVSPERPWSS